LATAAEREREEGVCGVLVGRGRRTGMWSMSIFTEQEATHGACNGLSNARPPYAAYLAGRGLLLPPLLLTRHDTVPRPPQHLHQTVPPLAVALVPHALPRRVEVGLPEGVQVPDAEVLRVHPRLQARLRRARRQRVARGRRERSVRLLRAHAGEEILDRDRARLLLRPPARRGGRHDRACACVRAC